MTTTYKRGQRIEKYEPLTKEQQKLVEENAHVIYAVFDKLNVNPYKGVDIDDIYGKCAVALCRAAQLYDKKKGKMTFFNFAFTYCEWAVLKYNEHTAYDWDNTRSFDFNYNDSEDRNFTLENIIADPHDSISSVIAVTFYKDLLKNETSVNQKIINSIICGESVVDIANKFGISRQRVYQIFSRFTKKARKAWCA